MKRSAVDRMQYKYFRNDGGRIFIVGIVDTGTEDDINIAKAWFQKNIAEFSTWG